MTLIKEVQPTLTGLDQICPLAISKMDQTKAMVVGMNHAKVMKEVLESRIKVMTIEMAIVTMIEVISNAVVSLIEEAQISREGQGMVTEVMVAKTSTGLKKKSKS